MALFNDLKSHDTRLAWPYGRHPARGTLLKHVEEFVGTEKQVTLRYGLGVGPWDAPEAIYYDGYVIDPANYAFHAGGYTDAPDAFFPGDPAVPGFTYLTVRLPSGMAQDGDPDKVVGIYRCLRLPNYDATGKLVKADGTAIPDGADPRDHLAFSASPARGSADLMRRAGAMKRYFLTPDAAGNAFTRAGHGLVNYDAVRFRSTGALPAPLTDDRDHYVVNAGANTFQVSATFGGAPVDLADAGTGALFCFCLRPRVWWNDWAHWRDYSAALIDWDPGTGVIHIPRFEAHLFFVPPFQLAAALDRICEVTCADWQRANGKIRFMTPEPRASIFTFDETKIGDGTFVTRPVDRRQKPNRVEVTYRDLDSQYIQEAGTEGAADPVVINRPKLQDAAGGIIQSHQIDGGGLRRSQAERTGNYYARSLCDADQEVEITGAPSAYVVLPADVNGFTHTVPAWVGAKFKTTIKEEDDFAKLGYRVVGRLYLDNAYSDTDHGPVDRPLPPGRPNPFAAPPQVTGLALQEFGGFAADGTWQPRILVTFNFGNCAVRQQARVEIQRTGEVTWTLAGMVEKPDGSAAASFAVSGIERGHYTVRVIATTRFASASAAGAPTAGIDVTSTEGPRAPVNGVGYRNANTGGWLFMWDPGAHTPDVLPQGEEIARYVIRIRNGAGGPVVRQHELTVAPVEPLQWTNVPFGGGDPCNPGLFSFNDVGGISHSGSTTDACRFESQPFTGRNKFNFTLSEKLPPPFVGAQSAAGSGAEVSALVFAYIVGGVPKIGPNLFDPSSNPPWAWRPLPGDQFSILLQNDQEIFIGPDGNISLQLSSAIVDLSQPYIVAVAFYWMGGSGADGSPSEIKRAQAEVSKMERFYYSPDAQRDDFAGVLQATVHVEIARISNNPLVGEGLAAQFTFVG